MKIETILDTPAILANQGAPVHLALRFTAPAVEARRHRPIAFAVVLDRSGSMRGGPLEQAKAACKLVVKNLRKDDLFALVIFDQNPLTLIPLQPVADKEAAYRAIDRVEAGGTTNLTGGWMLARDALKAAPADTPRKALLLTDGHLNVGITEPEQVKQVVAQGLEEHRVRTSTLGFGPDYDEDLLDGLATVTGGAYYDARDPEALPDIFDAELEGLQSLAVQNLRVRLRRSDFCEQAALLSDYPVVPQPEGGIEVTVGDLVSEEQRTLVLAMEVLPIPLVQGEPAASLEGEKLMEVKTLWDELTREAIASHSELRTIRVLPVQNPDEVVRNSDIIPFVAAQQAGKTVREVIEQVDRGQVEDAMEKLRAAIRRVEEYGTGADLSDALTTLNRALENLDVGLGGWVGDSRKAQRYRARLSSRMSSKDLPASLNLEEAAHSDPEERIHKLWEQGAPSWMIKEAMIKARRGRRKGDSGSTDEA